MYVHDERGIPGAPAEVRVFGCPVPWEVSLRVTEIQGISAVLRHKIFPVKLLLLEGFPGKRKENIESVQRPRPDPRAPTALPEAGVPPGLPWAVREPERLPGPSRAGARSASRGVTPRTMQCSQGGLSAAWAGGIPFLCSGAWNLHRAHRGAAYH